MNAVLLLVFFGVPGPPGLAAEARRFIASLYAIEAHGKARPSDERQAPRPTKTVPLLEEFRRWLDGHFPTLLPQGDLTQAFG